MHPQNHFRNLLWCSWRNYLKALYTPDARKKSLRTQKKWNKVGAKKFLRLVCRLRANFVSFPEMNSPHARKSKKFVWSVNTSRIRYRRKKVLFLRYFAKFVCPVQTNKQTNKHLFTQDYIDKFVLIWYIMTVFNLK